MGREAKGLPGPLGQSTSTWYLVINSRVLCTPFRSRTGGRPVNHLPREQNWRAGGQEKLSGQINNILIQYLKKLKLCKKKHYGEQNFKMLNKERIGITDFSFCLRPKMAWPGTALAFLDPSLLSIHTKDVLTLQGPLCDCRITNSARFSHLFHKLFYYMPGTSLGAGDITVNNQTKHLPPWALHLSGGNTN